MLKERIVAGFGWMHRRKTLDGMVTGRQDNDRHLSMKAYPDATRRVPSTVNRQPWCFDLKHNGITISVNNTRDT